MLSVLRGAREVADSAQIGLLLTYDRSMLS